MANILIADDNSDITDVLAAYAAKEGYTPVIAKDGEEAIRLFNSSSPEVVLLDVMMPKIDGYEVCRTIRRNSSVPVILITARGEEFEKVMGLDIGADDYIVKPFSPSEVMARVRAVKRRISASKEQVSANSGKVISIDNLTINLDEYTLSIGGEPITLTKKEIETILDNAEIGEGAIIAAGALVLKGTQVGDGEMWGGVPAKFIKKVDPEQAKELNIGIAKHYIMYADWYKED